MSDINNYSKTPKSKKYETSTPLKNIKDSENISSFNNSNSRTNIELLSISSLSIESLETTNDTIKLELEKDKYTRQIKMPNELTNEDKAIDTQLKIMNRLFTSLKTPDIIKDLPEYDGDPETLHFFLSNVDDIIELCRTQLPDRQETPTSFLKAIRNKIKGDAHKTLISYGTQDNWEDIKQTLIAHYSDNRTEVSLIRDLHKIFQGMNTVDNYYKRILRIQTTLINKAKISNDCANTKIELYKEMCLAQFLANLQEPLGSTIRSRNPKTLPEALKECQSEQNMHYQKIMTQNTSRTLTQPHNWLQMRPQINPQYQQPVKCSQQSFNFRPQNIQTNPIVPTFQQRTVRFNSQPTQREQFPNQQKYHQNIQFKHPAIKYERENKKLYNAQIEEGEETEYYEEENLEEQELTEEELNDEFFRDVASD